MSANNSNPPDITAWLYLILGISNLSVGEYLAGIAWISLSVSQFLIQRIGSWPSNMFRWDRPEVILAWLTYLLFGVLILYYVSRLLQSAFR